MKSNARQICRNTYLYRIWGFSVLALLLTCVVETKSNASDEDEVFIGTLKPDIASHEFAGNPPGTVKQGERFYYNVGTQQAHTQSGNVGFIPTEKVVRAKNQSVFQLKFLDTSFAIDPEDECVVAAKKRGVAYAEVFKKAISNDEDALWQLFELTAIMDGAATDLHNGNIWAVIHRWSDKKLHGAIEASKPKLRVQMREMLVNPEVTWPIIRPKAYLKRYYPKTFRALGL